MGCVCKSCQFILYRGGDKEGNALEVCFVGRKDALCEHGRRKIRFKLPAGMSDLA